MDSQALMNWVRYIAEIILSGDYSNEWLLELPKTSWDDIWEAGKWVAAWLGY